ncbi:hypothetical protein DQQ01_04950 [Blautia argi]|uniref:Uncharacterized protein n=1 Tax=Blautia argi TaxID=1912897 RepID=A0A2Z4U989_9FIRM|nr:hypothetical protein DQQ01_04950 [Blautia argi]
MDRFFSGDIFEDMRIRTGSSYISDLPYKKQQVWEELQKIQIEKYSKEQFMDFMNYVFGRE